MSNRLPSALETKARMIRAAAELFHRQGLGATSPDDIVKASGAGKGQFYHYFKNKQGVVHDVLRCYGKAIETGSAPLKYDIQTWQDLKDWFFAQLELQRSFGMTRSCPFGTIATGVTENHELIRQDLNLVFDLVADRLAAFFKAEKASNRVSGEANEKHMADFCIATAQGATLIGKITRDSRPVESAIRMALARLEHSSGTQETAESLHRPFRCRAAAAATCRPLGGVAVDSLPRSITGARPLDVLDTRLRMIEVAKDLFHEQGVGATSPDQIMEASRTGKGQFYHYFASKEGIVHAVLH